MEQSSRAIQKAKKSPLKIMIVEDDHETAELFLELLSTVDGFECMSPCRNLPRARRMIQQMKPDVLLLDLFLGDDHAGPFIHDVRFNLSKKTAILVCTVDHRPQAIFEALKNGAQGYLFKPVSGVELEKAIFEVTAGESPISKQIATLVVKHFHQLGEANKRISTLSPKEQKILHMLSRGLSYAQIADEAHITAATVRTHINRMYKKLVLRQFQWN